MNGTCIKCGKKEAVQMHHVVPDWHSKSIGCIRVPSDADWKVPMCAECHEKLHKEFFKKMKIWKKSAKGDRLFLRGKAIELVFDG